MRLPAGSFLDEKAIRYLLMTVRWVLDDPPPAARPRHLNELRALDIEWSATLGISPHGMFTNEPVPSEHRPTSGSIDSGMNEKRSTEVTDVQRAAARLGVTPQHVRRLAAAGSFPGAGRLGGSRGPWIIPEAALDLYEWNHR